MSPKSTMYKVNRIGPSTEPCGIPEVIGMESDLNPSERKSPITTAWVLPVRYDLNQLRVTPMTANLVLILLSSVP